MEHYIDAVNSCGAIADAKYLPEIDTGYDGLILCGGNDTDPKYYNEPMVGSVNIDAERDAVEFALLKAYIDAGKPVFGICRGFQLINIFFGGALHQDIPEAALHTRKNDVDDAHEITAAPDSIIGKVYGERLRVNSAHHQAVKVLGQDLRATAVWNDTYIEALEHRKLPIFGVQWHPERMCFSQKRADTEDGAKLFEYFLEMCEQHKNR